ncbi:hypothetical protein [Halomonas organivorans]|uniref:Uncharacterized protein n=1 Tax=Halomonas organivorans TaxID=257772 RepID=A0A7W5G5M3_9GAMM|nr:hypothetical protein [Halomonas organivorans]MBB3141245.1 hypothetical protein [Halomonas organivorans]
MSLHITMERLWVGQSTLHGKASRLRQKGEHEAANELDATAHRLGNQLLEVEAVVQQYAGELASLERPRPAKPQPFRQEAR